MKRFVIILSMLLTVLTMLAQSDSTRVSNKKERKVELVGQVLDSFTKVALKAHLTLMTAGDSAVVDTTTCFVWGNVSFFQFKVPARQTDYIIKGTCEGYEDGYVNYSLRHLARNNQFSLPDLLLKKRQDIYKEVGLDGVVVTGTRVKIAYRGDTIVYNASAFNLPDGSMLDGLIRQMPGAELKKNGDIYINGRKVDYLLLNGKDFFRGQNKVMLDNLPYFTVKELKVYDKSTRQSERIGHDVERKDYVMDVMLKRDYNRGFMGNVEAGAGTNDRYMGRLFSLYYDDHTRLSLFGNANNVNEDREPGGDGEWTPAEMPQGLRATKMTGLHFSSKDKDKRWEERLDATLTWSDAENENRTATETFAADGNIFGASQSLSRQKDFRFSANNDFSIKKLGLNANVGINLADGHRDSHQGDSTLRNVLINQSVNLGHNNYRMLNLSSYLWWFKKFEWGDFVSLTFNASYNRQKPNERFSIQDTHYGNANTGDDFRHYFTDVHEQGYSYSLAANYTYQLPRNWYINAKMGYDQQRQSVYNDYYRLDWLYRNNGNPAPQSSTLSSQLTVLPSTREALLSCLDTENTDDYQLLTRGFKPDISLSHTTENGFFHVNFPLNFMRQRLHYTDDTIDTLAHRHYTTFTPNFTFAQWGRNYRSVNYTMSVSQPDFQDLMPIDDATNPLAYRVNNPDLKARIDHHFSANSNWTNDSLKRTIGVNLEATITQRAWGTRTTYSPETGAYSYLTDNINGNWSVTLGGNYTQPIDHKRLLTIEQRPGASYIHSVDFAIDYGHEGETPEGNTRSAVNTLTLNDHLGLQFQRDDFTAGISGNVAYRRSTSSRTDFQRINAYDFDYGMTLNCTVPWIRFTMGTDLRMFSRRGYYSALMNDNHLVWNAQLSRTFLKGRLTAKLQAFDLLHQLSNTQYIVNAQGRTETWNNCIPRYALLTLTYKLTPKPKKS